MAIDMQPQRGDFSINLPITFDYKGGRSSNLKGKVVLTLLSVGLTGFFITAFMLNEDFLLWQKLVYSLGVFCVGLSIIRYFVLKEQYFSDVYETLKAKDYELSTEDIWQIFDIDFDYPYTCYFRNGYKGIFVRMEKDAITGKPDDAQFDHYEAIGDAYNLAHSLNMNIVHIDYMDTVGSDTRMEAMYDDLHFVSNTDLRDMLIDIYTNLQEVMSDNYASYDIYLYLTKGDMRNFLYGVQRVSNRMLGGNFLTYKILDRQEISRICVALFNLHDFSVVDASSRVVSNNSHSGIKPISVRHGDGTIDVFNLTVEERRVQTEESERKKKEAAEEALKKRHAARRAKRDARRGKKVQDNKPSNDVEVDLFNSGSDNDNVDLF